jgi:hypothetical protein
LNQILRRQTSRSQYGSKVPVVTVTVFKYRNKIGKIFVKGMIRLQKKEKKFKFKGKAIQKKQMLGLHLVS